MTKQVKHNKEAFDYILGAEDGQITITKYLNEKYWNEDFNEYFTKTEVIARSADPDFLSYAYEAMENDGIIGTIYTSSSMDYSKEYGFIENNTARDLWEKTVDIYRTRQFNERSFA
jgi:hypothetical protein